MAGRDLGNAFINVRPNSSGFAPLLEAQVKKAAAGVQASIPVRADARQVDAAMAGLKTRIQAVNEVLGKLQAKVTTKQAEAAIAKMQARLLSLANAASRVPIDADTRAIDAKITATEKKLAALRAEAGNMRADLDTKTAAASILALEKEAKTLSAQLGGMKSKIDIAQASARITEIRGQLASLSSNAAAVQIVADTRKLDSQIAAEEAKVKALRQSMSDIQADADTKAAAAKIAALEKQSQDLNKTLGNAKTRVDITAAQTKIAAVEAQLKTLRSNALAVKLAADNKAALAAIGAAEAKVSVLRLQLSDLTADLDVRAAASKLLMLEQAAGDLAADLDHLTADVDIREARAQLGEIGRQIEDLRGNAAVVKLAADNRQLLTAVSGAEIEVGMLRNEAANIRLKASDQGLASAHAELLGIEGSIDTLTKKSPALAHALGQVAEASAATTKSAFSWAVLTSHVQLFGGILQGILPKLLSTVTVWHLLLDGFIEFAAVLIPAAIAWGAFAAAAVKSSEDIYKRLTAINTEINATGRSVPQLSGSFAKLSEQVRPEVYQLFGEALVEAQHNTGGFAYVANAAGKSLDQLGARFVYATTQGKGVSDFMKGAATDAAQFGTLLGNLGGIFGNLLKAMPGIAEHLLAIAVAVTHAIEVFTAVAEPVINFVLLVHGVVLWTGIAATAVLSFVGVIAKMVQGLLTLAEAQTLSGLAAIKDFGIYIASTAIKIGRYVAGLYAIAAGNVAAGESSGILAAGLTALSDVPIIVWVTLAAAGIAALIYAFTRGDQAAKQFSDSIEKTLSGTSITNILGALTTAQGQAASEVASAQTKLAATTKYVGNVNFKTGQVTEQLTSAYRDQASHVQALQGVQAGVAAQAQLVSTRVGTLAKQYGGTTAALGALNAAGITSDQILDKNGQHWQETLIQVNATTQAYQLMGAQTGQLGNDLDVLGRTETTQYQAIQKLNQAWTQFIADVTGTQNSFDTVVQGFETLSTHSGELKLSLGKLKTAYTDNKAAIDGLSPQSIALNQAFGQQVVNIDKLVASLRTAALGNGEFKRGVRDAIQPMLQYAKGSSEATAQLVALAEEAGYTGPNSFQRLTEWVGHTKNATQDLKNITNDATVQEALLTNALTAQGNYMANKLVGDIANAVLAYDQVEQKARDYGNAIAQFGTQSSEAKAKQDILIDAIIRSGEATHKTTAEIAAMITKVTGIPAKKAIELVMTGQGKFSLSEVNAKTGKQQEAATGGYINAGGRLMRAAGGMIDLGTGPKADDVPAMLSKGEYVVQAASVSRYGKPMMDAINKGSYAEGGWVRRFADGGPVLAGDTSVLSGQYAVNQYNAFTKQATDAMVAAMRAGLKTAEAAAAKTAAAAGGGGNPGPGGPGTLSAKAIEGYWTGAGGPGGQVANIAQAITVPESGRRPSAVQQGQPYSTTGWGLWQITPGNSEPQAGINNALLNPHNNAIAAVAKYHGSGGFGPWTTYENGLYRPYLLAGGGLIPGGTYDRGGFLPTGLSLAFNGTGKPEPVGHLAPGPGGALAGLFHGLLSQGQGLGKLPGSVSDLSGSVSGLLGQLQSAGGLPGIVVGAGTPAGAGGFGLTRGDLGLPATTDSSSSAGSGGDTGSGDGTGTGTTTPAPAKKPAANSVQKLAAAPVKKLMSGYIWHNYLAQAKEANTTLNYLMDHTYDSKLGQIEFLDGVLASAQKRKNKSAEKAAEKLLSAQGVHVWKIQSSVKGNVPRDTAHKTVDKLMKQYIYNNNMTSAGQANTLLRHWGETRYGPELSKINQLDKLLAKYTKAKDAADVKATQALLKSYGVHNFKVIGTAAGGAGASSGSGGSSGSSGGSGSGATGTLAQLRATLGTRQGDEASAYTNLVTHYAQALSGAKAGSYIAAHKVSISGELATLAKRQAAEKGGYSALGGKGLTAAGLSHFATLVHDEQDTAADKYLDQGEVALTGSLKYWLNALSQTAAKKVPAKAMGGTVMDHGGWLSPGWNPPIWNGTGRPEPVGPAATSGNAEIVKELRALRGHVREQTGVIAASPAATGRHVASAVQAGGPATALSIRYPRTWS